MSSPTATDEAPKTGTNADVTAIVRSIGKEWWLIALFGVVTIAFGIVLTFKPSNSVHAIAVIFGVWLLIFGIVRLIQAISATGERTALVIVGLLAIIIALLVLHHTTTTVAVLGFIVGIFWTIGGAAEMLRGFSSNDGAVSWPVVILGLIALVVGILCLVYPSLSLSILCVLLGLGMIAYGIVEIVVSLHARTLKQA